MPVSGVSHAAPPHRVEKTPQAKADDTHAREQAMKARKVQVHKQVDPPKRHAVDVKA